MWALVPGLALLALMGVAASFLEEAARRLSGAPSVPVEALVIAILLGMVMRNTLGLPLVATRGVAFAGKQLLEFAVLILGASVNFAQLFQAGPRVILLIVLCVALALLVSSTTGRLIGLGPKLAILVAVGNAICGNSAIAAVAPAIRAKKEDVTMSIALTAVVGVVLVLGLPLLMPLLALTHYQYGVLVGTTVYAVPQVVAASFPVSVESGDVATFVKLLRVLMLGPVVLFFSLRFGGAESQNGQRRTWRDWRRSIIVPWFVTGFLALALLNSAGLFSGVAGVLGMAPGTIPAQAKDVSRLLMIIAMGALGLGVEFAAVKRVGPRVFAAVVTSVVFLLVLSLTLIHILGV